MRRHFALTLHFTAQNNPSSSYCMMTCEMQPRLNRHCWISAIARMKPGQIWPIGTGRRWRGRTEQNRACSVRLFKLAYSPAQGKNIFSWLYTQVFLEERL